MANETKIINKPKVTVDGDVSIDDSTPISTSGTITGTVSTNATIQGTPNVAVTGNVAIDDSTPIDTAVTGTVTTNATIQNATLATKGKTSYSDSTTDPDYWLGLYNDNQLIKKAVEISAGEIITSATFQATAVDTANGAIQITEFLDGSSNVTGRNSQVITWTQALQDLALPGITDILLSNATIQSGSAENDLIGNLTATGAVGAIVWTIETNASSLANIRIDDQRLEVGAGGLTSSPGSFILNIKAVDSVGKTRSENLTIAVTSGYLSSKSIKFDGNGYSASYLGLFCNTSIDNMTNCAGAKFNSTDGFALGMWYKSNNATPGAFDERIYTCGSNGWANRFELMFDVATSPDDLYLLWEVSNGNQFDIRWLASDIADGDWKHIVITYKGGTDYATWAAASHINNSTASIQLWVNGALVLPHSITVAGTPDATNIYHHGQTLSCTMMLAQSTSWNAVGVPTASADAAMFYLDEFTFWNRAMSSEDVAEMYNGGQLIDMTTLSFFSTANLGVWLKCGEHADDAIVTDAEDELYSTGVNSIIDNSGNNNHFLPCTTGASSIGNITIDSSNFAPDDGA
jgi:hypothetical protein